MLVLIGHKVAPRLTRFITYALAYSAVAGVLTGVVDRMEHG
jgi:hypothetical protein